MKFIKNLINHFIIVVCLIIILILPYFVFAGNPALDKLQEVGSGDSGPYQTVDTGIEISEFIGTVVSAFLSLLGVIFIVLILYAGYNWMTAQGDDEKVVKAKDTITRAITGLIIVIGSYAIWRLISYYLISKT